MFLVQTLPQGEIWKLIVSQMKAMGGYEVHLADVVLSDILDSFDKAQTSSMTKDLSIISPSLEWRVLPLIIGLKNEHSMISRITARRCLISLSFMSQGGDLAKNWCTVEFLTGHLLPVFSDSAFYRVGRAAAGDPEYKFNFEETLTKALHFQFEQTIQTQRNLLIKRIVQAVTNQPFKVRWFTVFC